MSEAPTLSPLVWDGDRAPLAKALVAAQKATESIKKAATNDHFKTNYADLAHVVEGVIPALNDAGVAVIQSPTFDGSMVSVSTMFLHETGASVTNTLHMRPSKTDPQGVGSAITYARRYALLAMAGGAPEDDDGNAASGPGPNVKDRPEPKRADPQPPTLAERADRLEATLKAVKVEEVEKAWGLGSAVLALLSVEMPDRLEELTKLYEFRRPQPETERAAA